ncbi:MAG: hypothetical protein A2504_11580 [Bdellovibrionales bacterium RIFOXYD12_FULL_39_22]|nr:MAG: hypothetical protein A2385_16095 [Bdellovibrionales bacterium RIFOXYB1_FULL_39_21]OFZ44521.1 MAG: hypothetical protein A2485_06800 [Bdellovibrionales bacterium RIFOXYC12_FULL_39_17]OFZ49837.1 MAG: hypothetical protein A2404_00665 [Bdellovibrionales bacterium RIFOXYC1_FULL_39_130]OFZ76842.1 MAG: hypothetical protein A2560_05465 [Bdellovibrionales bacterium RIFOXYD1_FULL_39_84]OFZ95769.1 MAG: hypothetical protein A2504_11580 [Bdellovibrionales bacterium RIFOXYD12_FULL_39_22]HLE10787.1 re
MAQNKQKQTILFMDDEELVQIIAKRVITGLGFDVEIVKNGEEAIAKYQEALANNAPYALAILDLYVNNGMGGVETIKKLLSLNPQITAIVSSGDDYSPIMRNFSQYGFKGALPKPLVLEELSSLLKKFLGPLP